MEKLGLNKKLIIFDLDGTLIDSTKQIVSAVDAARAKLKLPNANPEFLESKIGLPAKELFSDLELNTEDTDNAVAIFREHLKIIRINQSDVFESVFELLSSLKKMDLILSVATNKPTDLAKIALANVELLDFFDLVLGSDNLMPKPDPAILNYCLMHFGVEAAQAVMLGDRVEDMRAAHSAGVSGVGILQGTHKISELIDAGANRVFSNISEILVLVNKGWDFADL